MIVPSPRRRLFPIRQTGKDVYCDNAIEIPLKYGEVRVQNANA